MLHRGESLTSFMISSSLLSLGLLGSVLHVFDLNDDRKHPSIPPVRTRCTKSTRHTATSAHLLKSSPQSHPTSFAVQAEKNRLVFLHLIVIPLSLPLGLHWGSMTTFWPIPLYPFLCHCHTVLYPLFPNYELSRSSWMGISICLGGKRSL